MTAPLVQARGLIKTYQEGDRQHTVLHRLDLDVRRGEWVALLGRSGSGKSTLLNLLSGIDLPDAGTVQVAGTDLTALTERERTLFRRGHMGFVFQFFNLVPTLSVEENLLLPLELGGKLTAETRSRARDLLAEVGLADRAASYPDRLSGGEQQRVAIVRALIHGPDLLLADEPTGNLDAETGERVLDLLIRLGRGTGMTLIMVTHSDEVARLADRVLVMREGQVEERLGAEAPP